MNLTKIKKKLFLILIGSLVMAFLTYPLLSLIRIDEYVWDFVHGIWILLMLSGPITFAYYIASNYRRNEYLSRLLIKIILFFALVLLFGFVVRAFRLSPAGDTPIWLFVLSTIGGAVGIFWGRYLWNVKGSRTSLIIFEIVIFGLVPTLSGSLLIPIWHETIMVFWAIVDVP